MTSSDPNPSLLAPAFYFKFAVPCFYYDGPLSKKAPALGEAYRLPNFRDLDKPDRSPTQPWADVRAGWNDDGLIFEVHVTGKSQPPWCRQSRIDGSDGLAIWIDTRNAPGIHRASRFCHAFRFLPSGGGTRLKDAVARQMVVARARENAPHVDPDRYPVRSKLSADGYFLQATLKADALAGFDPEEHPALGFTFVLVDRELGDYPMTVGLEFPIDTDPSLWSTLDLVRDTPRT